MQIDFSFSVGEAQFRDAIVLPDDHGLTDAEIEAIKQQRLANWLAVTQAAQEAANGD